MGHIRFFATKPRRHKVSRSVFVVPLCLCVFVANFFGCVKGGTHPIFPMPRNSGKRKFPANWILNLLSGIGVLIWRYLNSFI
ncbi:Uncharacterized protein dnm_098480 [Desulfonema magnum]|uniref:Uncharacterized protein n=1 Tax=Desulfonema magnum TaxID=45655 RepID=A0A975C0F2_9BACT|nr:Uncharacterized protein dnm_098480 [Desulfonema magnum]